MKKKMMKPRGKKVAQNDFVAEDEVYDRKTAKKEDKNMKTAGIERLLKKAQKQMGYSDKPRVKPSIKTKGLVSGQKKIK